jgi:hypothetical protein
MIKNEVEHLCFNEKSNYEEKEERRNQKRTAEGEELKRISISFYVEENLADIVR